MSNIGRGRTSGKRLLLLAVGLLVLCVTLTVIVLLVLPGWLNAPPLSEVRANADRYDQVVRLIEAGDMPGGFFDGGAVELPLEYHDLSPARDGQVLIYREESVTRVLLYLPGFTSYTTWVYMYTSDDQPMDTHGECSGAERERPNWYTFHCP